MIMHSDVGLLTVGRYRQSMIHIVAQPEEID